MKWLILAVRRTGQLIGFPIAFLMISCINGLVIRIALLSSNIILVPVMVVLQRLRINEDERSRAIVYHSMGLIGAQMAYYDSVRKSKLMFCFSVCICLTLTYFVQTCCFFIWSKVVFPRTYPNGLGDLYFAYLNFFEFSWFLFARSRLTLKFYPKMVTILNIAFFVYINSYAYAAST